jgi:hypothetical protein
LYVGHSGPVGFVTVGRGPCAVGVTASEVVEAVLESPAAVLVVLPETISVEVGSVGAEVEVTVEASGANTI